MRRPRPRRSAHVGPRPAVLRRDHIRPAGMLLLSSSHLTVHTWPEHGYAAIDVFHCDPSAGAGATSTPPATSALIGVDVQAVQSPLSR